MNGRQNHATALTERGQWDAVWSRRSAVGPPRRGWYPDERFIRLFDSLPVERSGPTVLEVGAGASRWLPYLGVAWGARVWGLDYSAPGCELARGALAAAGVNGTVVQRDLFEANEDLLGGFDLVYSLGLIEHFADTRGVVMSMARFVRPGGVILSVVPNMCGAMGLLQKLVDKEIYAEHERLSPQALSEAHEGAGLTTLNARWFGSYDPTVVNEGRSSFLTDRSLSGWRWATRTPVWAVLRSVGAEPEGRAFSPYVVCTARRSNTGT